MGREAARRSADLPLARPGALRGRSANPPSRPEWKTAEPRPTALIFLGRIIIFVVFVESTPGTGDETVRKKVRAVGDYAGLGIQLGATVVVFFFLGYYLDRYFGTLPLFTILGTFVGAGATFYSIYRRVFPGKKDEGR